ncbi:allantoinase AllB [Streptomyces sp. NBC_00728]|jgi:allantoinase|uniref:allantoinase AllB n=1 Tax=Streptomyces sp. NBC_00728 TaxID=2903676 RepID=UPI00386A220A
MEAVDTVIRADRVMTSEGERAASIGIVNGRIRFIEDIEAALPAREEIRVDADVVVLPGLVDTHVHLQDPGQSAWEGFDSGTRAAAAGGITTVVDMPLDSLPVTVDVPALEVKRKAASGRTHVDLGFWAGVTPSNIPRLGELHRAGVLGFKCFLANTGLPEFPPVSVDEMKAALTELKKFGGFLAVHAEDAAEMAAIEMVPGRSYQDFLAVHPPHIEDLAVSAVIEATRATGGRSHIVHISSARAAGLIQSARADGLEISAETCPHYLTLTSVEVPDGDTSFKVCPPIRDAANADRLWAALSAGSLSMIVSDHSPCAIEHKALDKGDFAEAFGGISSLQIALPAVWTEARRRGHSLADVAHWMARQPAELVGLERKGAIAPGYDADLCFLAPDEKFTVEPTALYHRQPITPYAGRELYGAVRQTWLRGRRIDFSRPRGRLLTSSDVAR